MKIEMACLFFPFFIHAMQKKIRQREERVNFWGFGHGGGEDGNCIKQVKMKGESITTEKERKN